MSSETTLNETEPAESVPAETVPAETVPAGTVPAETVPAETVPANANWPLVQRLLLRFGLIYFLLYTHPFPLNWIPNPRTVETAFSFEWGWLAVTDPFYEALDKYTQWAQGREWAAIDWMAKNLFSIEEALDRPYGSGDPTHSYIQLLLHVLLALVGTLIWSLAARKKSAHPRLASWLLIGARFNLAITMFSYGFAKVIPAQFRPPGLGRLLASWGDSSPMNVLWTFMGSSEAYIIFSGAGEVLGGLLLLFRRTATLGGLVTAGVMANVVALNFFYDVPVKLYSSHLLLMAACICIPDLKRLFYVLVLNRDAQRRDLRKPVIPIVLRVVKWVVIGFALLGMLPGRLDRFEASRQKPELYGIWDVEHFILDGQEVPPLQSDPVRWQNLLVESERFAVLRGMDDTRWSHRLTVDEENGTLALSAESTWIYQLDGPDSLVLQGEFQRISRAVPWEEEGPDNPAVPREPQIEVKLTRVEIKPELESWPEPGAGPQPEPGEPDEPDAEAALPEPANPANSSGLQGNWRVISFEVIGDTFTPRRRSLPMDWIAMTVEQEKVVVELDNGHRDEYTLVLEEAAKKMKLSSESVLTMNRVSEDQLQLTGTRGDHEIDVELTRRDLQEFLLVRRGFHWINEIPLNRF